MGTMVNPGNKAFRDESSSWIYVDKTGLINYTNRVCDTSNKFVCNSRPRRFGKSYTADMLTAYYSRGCDSRALFDRFEISRSDHYETFLNRCDVIHFDVQWCILAAASLGEDLIHYLNRTITGELAQEYPDADLSDAPSVFTALNALNTQLGKTFVIIIDEWDAPIRDSAAGQKTQDAYICFLRGMFKGSAPMTYIKLAYMTGILPVRREKTESALNNFSPEFTMLNPGPLAKYIGFTDEDVRTLCAEHGMPYEDVRKWYDGYRLKNYQIYNPNSVISCLLNGECGTYWTATASFESVRPYINLDFAGLQRTLTDMIAGLRVSVNTTTFENYIDRSAFHSRDDVFTYMIHLGYLAYDSGKSEAFIPNEEIRQVIAREVSGSGWDSFDAFEAQSEELLHSTIAKDGDSVAALIEEIHDRYASSIWYNNENSLAAVVTIGYLATLKYYFRPVREMPAGRGFADIVYIPRPEYLPDYPALVIELKWNRDVRTALDQIREKHYTETFRDYTGNILLVGITYDRRSRTHVCRIEEDAK